MRQYCDGNKLEFTDGTTFILSAREACILNYVTVEYPLKEESCECDCHMFVGGSGQPCPDCKENKCAYCVEGVQE